MQDFYYMNLFAAYRVSSVWRSTYLTANVLPVQRAAEHSYRAYGCTFRAIESWSPRVPSSQWLIIIDLQPLSASTSSSKRATERRAEKLSLGL